MKALPEDLQQDATLQRFKSVEELAKGHVEAHRLAKEKVRLPNPEDPDSFVRFAAAVRPESADAYEFDTPEGMDNSLADAMRPKFFETGLLPQQAKALADGFDEIMAATRQEAEQKGQAELDALKADMGDAEFEQGKIAAANMLDRMGIPVDFENDLSRFVGGGNTLRMLMGIAKANGELGRVDGTDVDLAMGALKGEAAKAEAERMIKADKGVGKLRDASSPERKRYNQLVQAASQEG